MTQESPPETLITKYTQIWDNFKTATPLTQAQLAQRHYKDDNVILFYYSDHFMSNFSHHAVSITTLWPNSHLRAVCSENLFQSMKFYHGNPDYAYRIATAGTARESADLGRNRSIPGFDPDWLSKRVPWMVQVLIVKIQEHPRLRESLLATGSRILIENTSRAKHTDDEWGCGRSGQGKNYLGICWMVVRELCMENCV